MKIKTLAIVVLSALSLSSAAALADTTTVNGGTVHFKGEVVNAACAVDAGSVDQTVQLGQVRTASLKQAGATSSAVGFNIQLNDCDTTVATKAAVAFLGTAIDATRTDVLALQSSAAGSATNVGVQILDRTGNALTLDGATFSAQTTLNNGTNTIPFQARYYAIGEATPEESPENKTGIVRCDLIDCANNFKEITTMPARSLCQNFLNNILAPLHLYRQKSLIDATNAVINGASLTLTSIGRHLTGTASVKNKIKRVDRLLGNRHLQNEVSTIFQRITQKITRGMSRVVLLIDWSAYHASRFLLLLASLALGKQDKNVGNGWEKVSDSITKATTTAI